MKQAGEGCKFYINNTLASSWIEEYLELLGRIFQACKDLGLLINTKKTKLFYSSVDFLSLKGKKLM